MDVPTEVKVVAESVEGSILDKVKNIKAEIFDLLVSHENIAQLKQNKLKELQDLLNEVNKTTKS